MDFKLLTSRWIGDGEACRINPVFGLRNLDTIDFQGDQLQFVAVEYERRSNLDALIAFEHGFHRDQGLFGFQLEHEIDLAGRVGWRAVVFQADGVALIGSQWTGFLVRLGRDRGRAPFAWPRQFHQKP